MKTNKFFLASIASLVFFSSGAQAVKDCTHVVEAQVDVDKYPGRAPKMRMINYFEDTHQLKQKYDGERWSCEIPGNNFSTGEFTRGNTLMAAYEADICCDHDPKQSIK